MSATRWFNPLLDAASALATRSSSALSCLWVSTLVVSSIDFFLSLNSLVLACARALFAAISAW